MDPNANLDEQRRIVARIFATDGQTDIEYRDRNQLIADDGARLAELSQALDEWISKGGFLPDAWRK